MLSFASYKLHLQRMYHYYTESRDRQAKLQARVAVSDQSVAFPVTYFLPLMVPSALLVSLKILWDPSATGTARLSVHMRLRFALFLVMLPVCPVFQWLS